MRTLSGKKRMALIATAVALASAAGVSASTASAASPTPVSIQATSSSRWGWTRPCSSPTTPSSDAPRSGRCTRATGP